MALGWSNELLVARSLQVLKDCLRLIRNSELRELTSSKASVTSSNRAGQAKGLTGR